MTQLLGKIFRLVLMVYVFVFAYQWWKPTPEFMTKQPLVYMVPDSEVHFLADTTFTDKYGKRQVDQHIWDQIFKSIGSAKHSILLDMFLYNDFQTAVPETTRKLSQELTDALITKKTADKHIAIALITDPINTVYGGVVSPYFETLQKSGIVIITTDLSKLPDSNLLWGSLWRPLFSWWGNSQGHGWLAHPFQYGGSKVTLRSWLDLINFKANHRKLLVADEPIMKGQKQVGQKMVTIVTSSNPHDASSAHGNVLLKVDDHVWQDALQNERFVAESSNSGLPIYNIGDVNDATGSLKVSLLHDELIKEKALDLINAANLTSHIDLAMFYLSDRDIISALVSAANRGVHVRVILDPNKDAFGFDKNGIPNQPVAKELVNNSHEAITVRWCDTHGEQCHGKLLMGDTATTSFMMLGSANFTRRNIGGYNLEEDIFVEGSVQFHAWKDANSYFGKMWDNTGGTYTANYETYQDNTVWKSSLYRVMEMTGLSSF